MGSKLDLYEQWKRDGELDKVLAFIRDCSTKLVTQREMCEAIGINEGTFTKLKKKHPEIQKIINDARLNLKCDLIDSLLKKAQGFEVVEEENWVEETDKGERKKSHTTKNCIPPDYKSIVYILTKRFGKEFSERYEELKLAEKKLDNKESWDATEGQTDSQEDKD